MKIKDICTVDQIDNSTDATNVIIDESGNLRKVNLKKAVNNFIPPPEKIEQIQQNTNDIEWMRSDISDLKTQVRSLAKDNTELKSNKINTSDIIDNLTTDDNSKVLSAAQGVALKSLVDKKVDLPKDNDDNPLNGTSGQILQSNGDGTTKWVDKLTTGGITEETDPTVPAWAKNQLNQHILRMKLVQIRLAQQKIKYLYTIVILMHIMILET